MGEETGGDRREFIGRIGTYFLVLGAIALLIFVAADLSRTDEFRMAQATQTHLVLGVQALQTRDAGVRTAIYLNQPTPTMVRPKDIEATQRYLVLGVQAIQTRDAAATENGWRLSPPPTQTLIPTYVLDRGEYTLSFFSLFCLGAIGILLGFVIRRRTAPPSKASGRFSGLRNLQQKQKEAKAKREAAKKEKEAKKKK